MICVATDDFSPSQIGIPITRMSAAITRSKISGQSSRSQPCSVMSGQTPVAIWWSIARMPSTATPLRRMISIAMSISPCVWEQLGAALERAVDEERLEVRVVGGAALAQLGLPGR